MSEKHIGEVVQVIGPVLDIRFAHDELPALLNAIEIESNGAKLTSFRARPICPLAPAIHTFNILFLLHKKSVDSE